MYPNIKVHINYRSLLLSVLGRFSIIRFKIRLLTFAKSEEFRRSSTVKAGLNVFFLIFRCRDMFKLR